jgi:sugar/nucleoside kinase (ribokinase family)
MAKKVLGLGNALVDIMTRLDNDALLDTFGLKKGSMQLVDKTFSKKILDGTADLKKDLASGGSAANTIHGLARLGVETGFIGKIGKDEYGDFFRSDMIRSGITPTLFTGADETGRAIALVSKDSERTFATFLGAAIELSAADLTPEAFRGYDIFHIEGYLVQNYDLIRTAVKIAKDQGMLVALDMASYNVVEQNKDFLLDLVRNHVDIVFANEEEAKAFTSAEPEDALHKIAEICEIAVVKTGKEGSLIKKGGDVHRISAIEANSIDTTGAGDIYAAGFLYGLVNDLPLDRCGNIGSLLAGHVIEFIGAKMDDARWEKLTSMINSI